MIQRGCGIMQKAQMERGNGGIENMDMIAMPRFFRACLHYGSAARQVINQMANLSLAWNPANQPTRDVNYVISRSWANEPGVFSLPMLFAFMHRLAY